MILKNDFLSLVLLCLFLFCCAYLIVQVIQGESVYDSASDIYSFGIVIYELFSRTIPFSNINELLQVCLSLFISLFVFYSI
jgi:serine/threonine protein kinase